MKHSTGDRADSMRRLGGLRRLLKPTDPHAEWDAQSTLLTIKIVTNYLGMGVNMTLK
jgi:hypothetical protein